MDPARMNRRAPEWQVWTALLIVYFVWGSTYLAISVVDETMPPLLAAGLRHLTAGTILFGLLLVTRRGHALRLSRADGWCAAFVGLALLLGGNGLVVLAETSVPSGLTALIIASVPALRRAAATRVSASASRWARTWALPSALPGWPCSSSRAASAAASRWWACSCSSVPRCRGRSARTSRAASRCRAIRSRRPAARCWSVAAACSSSG